MRHEIGAFKCERVKSFPGLSSENQKLVLIKITVSLLLMKLEMIGKTPAILTEIVVSPEVTQSCKMP